MDVDDDDLDENSFTLDIQRNHSSRTANKKYGGTSGHSMDRSSEVRFRRASEQWHKFWSVS
jgi:hypothetical protein